MSKLVQRIKDILRWGLETVGKVVDRTLGNRIIDETIDATKCVVKSITEDKELDKIKSKVSDCNDEIIESMIEKDEHKKEVFTEVTKYLEVKENEMRISKLKKGIRKSIIAGTIAGTIVCVVGIGITYIKYS